MKKRPVQQRSRATVAVILEGTAQVLERGAPLTTNHIAERAGVSIGTLYQYFATKESVIAELSRVTRCEMLRSVIVSLDCSTSRDLRGSLPELLGAAVDAKRRRPRLALALDGLEARLPLAEDAAVVTAVLRARLSRWMGSYLSGKSGRELDVIAADIHTVVGTLTSLSLAKGLALDDGFLRRAAACVETLVGCR